jgi:hypothetical protein
MRSRFCASAIVCWGLALSPDSPATAAERCALPSSDIVGLRVSDGRCVGVRRDIVTKFLKTMRSECAPPPRYGVSMLGRCVADDPGQAEDEAYALADRVLAEADEALSGDIADIRAELDRQFADMSARMEELRGKLSQRHPEWRD